MKRRKTIDLITSVLTKTVAPETRAIIVNQLLCVEAEPTCTDDESLVGGELLDALCDYDTSLPDRAMNL